MNKSIVYKIGNKNYPKIYQVLLTNYLYNFLQILNFSKTRLGQCSHPSKLCLRVSTPVHFFINQFILKPTRETLPCPRKEKITID